MKIQIKPILYKIEKSVKCFRKDRNSFGLSYKLWHKKNRDMFKKLKKFKSIHKGESCFIVGTGPSLKLEDIEKIKHTNAKCFGVNTLYKIYENTSWRADYYCIIDPTTYSAIRDGVKKYHTNSLFIAGNRIFEENIDINRFALNCSSFYRLAYKEYFGATEFSTDLCNEIYDGASVVYAALQIAVYMGFKDIYLLGVDCNYEKNSILHSKTLAYGKDYKYNWTKQTGLTMIECFKVAKEYADKNNVHIYNAAAGGMLEVFPRVGLDDAIRRINDYKRFS